MEIAVSLIIFVFGLFILLRNEVVRRVEKKAIAYVFARDNWEDLAKRLENPGQIKKIFIFHKWTFKQFYPDFKD